jgi:hypothetical protein
LLTKGSRPSNLGLTWILYLGEYFIRFKFSIAALLVLTLLGALASRWYTARPIEGVEEWTEFCFLDYSIGIAELSFQNDRYDTCTVISGDGSYCHIEEGGHILNSTGGWYFSIGIQLPEEIVPGLIVDLKSVTLDPTCKIKKMVPGETTVIQFGNPIAWELASDQNDIVGTLKVESITADTVTVLVDSNFPLVGFDPRNIPRNLEINRSFQLERVDPKYPLSELPRKSQITKE